jgi:hypothetical protein
MLLAQSLANLDTKPDLALLYGLEATRFRDTADSRSALFIALDHASYLDLLAPYRSAKRDPHPLCRAMRSRVRHRIDTVFGQLVERYAVKRDWARDLWHLCSRLLRKVLMHTPAVHFNVVRGTPPLQLARLVAS